MIIELNTIRTNKLYNFIKNLIKPLFYIFLTYFCFIKIFWQLRTNKNKEVYFIDIDNTLSDTYHSYKYHYSTYEKRLSSLAIFIGMRNKIIHLLKYKNNCFFLSARKFSSKKTTLNWLLSNEIKINVKKVFCLNNAKVKINLISLLVNSLKIRLILIDDLSYNHENGKIIYYQNHIENLKKMNVEHISASQINEINKNFNL
tara:strand:+ start:1349 stop:1951 length:603 start_codon:yes stop_codon:yes gene_type:complete